MIVSCMEVVSNVSWKLSGRCLQGVWKMSGWQCGFFPESLCNGSEECPEVD